MLIYMVTLTTLARSCFDPQAAFGLPPPVDTSAQVPAADLEEERRRREDDRLFALVQGGVFADCKT